MTSYFYLQELDKLDCTRKWIEFGNSPLLTKNGYFIFDSYHLESHLRHSDMITTLKESTKFYISGIYSQVYESLELLIQNDLHHQITMLDITISVFDSKHNEWSLLKKFTNLKLLNFDSSEAPYYSKNVLERFIEFIPLSIEALCINYHWFNNSLDHLTNSNIKVLKLITIKFNQAIDSLPHMLETLIIKSGDFNKKIDNLPVTLKHLILLCAKMRESMDYLPHGLEYFAGLYFNCFIYPDSVFEGNFQNLPKTLKYIMLDECQYEKHHLELKNDLAGCRISQYTNYYDHKEILSHLINTFNSAQ